MSCKSNDKDFKENTEWGSHFRKIILKYRTKGNVPAKEEILFPYIPLPYTRQWGGGGGVREMYHVMFFAVFPSTLQAM